MPCHSEIGQSKSLFLLTVALLCFQGKKLPFSHGNGHSDRLTEWLFLYNYRTKCRLANTKDLRFSTYSLSPGVWQSFVTIRSCNGLFHFLSVQGDGRKKFKSIFALDFFDMNILPPGKQLGEFQ